LIWAQTSLPAKGSVPFDHDFILETALNRLRSKLRYTNIAKGFLQETFRTAGLQADYEMVVGHSLNRTNFRDKVLKIKMIERVSVLTDAVGEKGGRPPYLYASPRDLVEAVDRNFP
jgi:8-oxo-dGTP diphosphatase